MDGLRAIAFVIATSSLPAALAQSAPPQTPAPAASVNPSSDATPAQAAPAPQVSGASPAPAPKTYTVPAGTKVLLQLNSSINSHSAKPGDGVYLTSTFPVVVDNRVMIPSGVYVQGVVDRVVQAGRVKGKSQLDMHFTSMIFPNGTVVEIPGMVNSLPGASKQSVKDNGEGTIEQSSDKGRHAGETAKIAIPTGAGVGSIAGLGDGHPIEGGLVGFGAGLATVGIVSLFTRGADVQIPSGSQVEMVLQRPLLLEEANLSASVPPGGYSPARGYVPSPNQPRPLGKPSPHPDQVICPPGSLGCQ